MRMDARSLVLCLGLVAVSAAPAGAASFGSLLNRPANTGFGCEAAPVYDPFAGGATLQPTGQTACTLRSGGRIGSLRNWSNAPGTGRITRIRVRSGQNPALLRLTILQASTRANPSGGGGDYLCCTARYLGRVFRPRANTVTSLAVNVRVSRQRVDRTTYFDVVGLSVMGPGTLPVNDDGSGGQLRSGSPLTVFSYPYMRRGQPRVDGLSADGLELLLRWDFRPGR